MPIEPRLLTITELQAYTRFGRDKAKRFAREHGAVIRDGRMYYYDRAAIDKALDEMREPAQAETASAEA